MTSIEILKFFILIFLVGCQTCSSSKADGDIQTALGGGTGFLIKDPIWWKGRRIHEPPLAAKLNHGKGDDMSTGDVIASIYEYRFAKGFWRYSNYGTKGGDDQS